MYLESYLNDIPSAIEPSLGFLQVLWTLFSYTTTVVNGFLLQKIYISLDDNDGVAGVAAKRKSGSALRELTLEYESVGKEWLLQEATCTV